MDFVPSICLSSLAGAVLFFTGGRFSPRGAAPDPRAAAEHERAAERAAEHERAAARAAEALRGAQQSHEEAVRAVAEARARGAEARQELASERADRAAAERAAAAEIERLGEEVGRQRAQAVELASQLAALRARFVQDAGEVTRAKAQGGATEARAAAAEKRVAVFATDLDRARRDLHDATTARARAEQQLAAAAAELAAARAAAAELAAARAAAVELRQENAALTRANEALEAERARRAASAEDLAELQRRSVELAMRSRVHEQRAGEMERKDAENVELRGKVEALEGLAAEAIVLRRKVLDLEARGFARQLLDGPPETRPTRPAGELPRLETSLEQGLAELVAHDPGCRTAVLSDLRGLLIACAGAADHQHELAAATSLTTYAAERLRELVPLGEPASLELCDENGLVVRTRWLRWDQERFLLSTLGASPAPGEAEVALGKITARLAALIGGA